MGYERLRIFRCLLDTYPLCVLLFWTSNPTEREVLCKLRLIDALDIQSLILQYNNKG